MILSELARHRVLLSSSAVFIFYKGRERDSRKKEIEEEKVERRKLSYRQVKYGGKNNESKIR